MSYYFAKTVDASLEEAESRVRDRLAEEGFGILTEIDVATTLKKKLDADMRPYKILGACNPPFAYKALQAEERIGLMMPCNVVVRETEAGKAEVSAIDPVASMQAVGNSDLAGAASEVGEKLRKVIEGL